MHLSMCLQAVVCQQLLPHLSGRGRVLATEVMTATPAVRNLIREGKTPQIANAIATSGAEGNQLMDSSLINLYKQRKISSDVAIKHAHDPEYVRRHTLF
jgi:twitching motility protein PilT